MALKLANNLNRLRKVIDVIDTKPVGPKHPYQNYVECSKLDSDLSKEYARRFGDKKRLTWDEARKFLTDMYEKYPKMKDLYPKPPWTACFIVTKGEVPVFPESIP